MPAFSDIQHIREAFFDLDRPEWELYNGKKSGRPNENSRTSSLIAESPEGASIEDSWETLSTWLERVSYRGGASTLFVGNKEKTPYRTMVLHLSKHTMKNPPTIGRGANEYSAIGGYKGINEMLELRMQNYDLARKIEDMQNPQGSFFEQIGQRLVESVDFNALIPAVVNMVNGFASKQGIQGIPQAAFQPEQKTDQENVSIEGKEKDLESSIESLMQTIALHMQGDETEMKKFFDGVNQAINQNPQILQQLKR